MSELLGSAFSGGEFTPRAAISGNLTPPLFGDILTITPPAGQKVRLTHLSTATPSDESGISVSFGASVLVSALALTGDNPSSGTRFSVGNYQPYAAATPPAGNFQYFTGKTDEPLIINKDIGGTSVTIYYGYEIGE